MNKKYRVVSKVRFSLFIIILLSLIIGAAAFIARPTIVVGSTEPTYEFVTVNDGDTLWSIASKFADENTNLRMFIYEISQLNDIEGSEISPGQEIKIPR